MRISRPGKTNSKEHKNFLLAWEDCFQDEWIFVSALIEELKSSGNATGSAPDSAGSAGSLRVVEEEGTTRRISLAEALPDSQKFALEELEKKPRALEKRIETPYGKENLRIERDKDDHAKQQRWRVVRVVRVVPSPSYTREKNILESNRGGGKC